MASAAAHKAAPPADETDRLIAALREIIWRWSAPAHRESLELHKALRLAPRLDVWKALCRGEKVPLTRLDPGWAKAYGLR